MNQEQICCIEKLLTHLNQHKVHYHTAIWLQESPNDRAVRFDQYRWHGHSLLDYIDNHPLTVHGASLVFPANLVGGPRLILDVDADELSEPETASRIVSLPTRGVFAEAQLSSCNVTEKRDVTRMKDWSESPCRPAPDISNVSPGSRAQNQDLTPSQWPNPLVNIVNPPAAPDPSGLSGALNLLGQPNIFRDMSGRQELAGLLQNLSEGTIDLATAQAKARNMGDTEAARTLARAVRDQAHRQEDPTRMLDRERVIAESNASDEAKQRASERNINGEKEPASRRAFPEVKELQTETVADTVRGTILLANFGIGSHDLRPEHKEFLRYQLVPNLSDEGRIPLLEGHASETGSEQDNQALSERRAEAVRDFLVSELGFPAHQILEVKGVGENEPVDAEGPIEDPAERSVVLQYEALTIAPAIRKPDVPVEDPDSEKFTQWQMKIKFKHIDSLKDIAGFIDKPGKIATELLEQKKFVVKLRNREQANPQTLEGVIKYRGLNVGVWLTTPPDSDDTWTPWIDFETTDPMAEIEWHGERGDIQIGTGSTGGFTSGVQGLVLRLAPMKGVIQTQVRLTTDDKAIGVQGGSSLLSVLPAQLWLTDPKPQMRRKEEDEWIWGFSF